MARMIKFTAKASGMLDARVPDTGQHFTRDEVKPCTDEQAELLLRNLDFEEVFESKPAAKNVVASDQKEATE